MSSTTLQPRLKASGIHFFLSMLTFLAVLYLVVFLWYPKPHFTTSGGWQGLRIILFVHVILGPFLTLIIFNPGKSAKAILFDLTAIGTIQISALIWGLSVIYSQRPVAISFVKGHFYSITAANLKTVGLKHEQIKKLSHQHPAVIYSRKPEKDKEETGVGRFKYLYFPLEDHIDELFEASLVNLPDTDDNFQINKAHWLKQTGMNEKELTFITFVGRYGNSILILNRKGELIDSIKVDL